MLMAEMSLLEQEHLKTILLDTRNQVLSVETVYIGSVNYAQVRVGDVFKMALRKNAVAMILAHNHPSGNLEPSTADISLTRKLRDGGKVLDIMVIDHLILGAEGYYSFADAGMM